MSDSRTIVVLGGGSAGLTAATTAAREGARVVLFLGPKPDRASLCVNLGCMPSKAMFEPIDALAHARLHAPIPALDNDRFLRHIVAWKNTHIARFRAYRQTAIRGLDSDSFRIVRASGTFTDPHTVVADGERFAFDAAIIATGSRPARPPIDGLKACAEHLWTNEEILFNEHVPESLIVIGAGAIGLEFSLRYARLGARVTVVSHSATLPAFPAAFGRRLQRIYEREGVRMLPFHRVRRIRRDVEGHVIVETESDDGFEPLVGERVLMAVGRGPNVGRLDIDRAGVELDDRGRFEVSDDMRIAGHDHLFAAGDVIGQRMIVHHAHIEAGIAAENAVSEGTRRWDQRANIQVVFSDPEFAYAGLTEAEIEQRGVETVSATKQSIHVGKLYLAGDDLGFGSFSADAVTGRLVAAGLLCGSASDLIHLPGYLIEHGRTVQEAAAGEFYHPTRAEIVSGILDRLCSELGGHPYERATE